MNTPRKNIVGQPINFRGLTYAPVNEQGVVLLFGMLARELGFHVQLVRQGYPDCKAVHFLGNGRYEEVNIEFEFRSSGFKAHFNSEIKSDFIVCWEHDWSGCPTTIEVLELRSIIQSGQLDSAPPNTAFAGTAEWQNDFQSTAVSVKEQRNAEALSGRNTDQMQRDGKAQTKNPAAFHSLCRQAIEAKLRVALKTDNQTSYVSADGIVAVVCLVSKEHLNRSFQYWFGFRLKQAGFLAKHKKSFLVLGCGSGPTILAIPFRRFETWTKELNITKSDDGNYYHIRINCESHRFYLHLKGRGMKVEITSFLLK